MKLGGGLTYVAGPMGAGKTYWGVRQTVFALLRGEYVITNVRLLDGWEERVARKVSRANRGRRNRVAQRVKRLYVYEPELQVVTSVRVPGKGEARALFLWDETHNDLNNRDWRNDYQKTVLKWATQLRKLGFAGFLLSQHQDNTDVALRRVANYLVRVQNQREQTRMLGMRVTPWPLFLARWDASNVAIAMQSKVKPVRVERYFLGWYRHLYDTLDLYHGLDVDEAEGRVLRLPAGGIDAGAWADHRARFLELATGTAPADPSPRPSAEDGPDVAKPQGPDVAADSMQAPDELDGEPHCSRGCCTLPAWAKFDPHSGLALTA